MPPRRILSAVTESAACASSRASYSCASRNADNARARRAIRLVGKDADGGGLDRDVDAVPGELGDVLGGQRGPAFPAVLVFAPDADHAISPRPDDGRGMLAAGIKAARRTRDD